MESYEDRIKRGIDEKGYSEIQSGVYLWSGPSLASDQPELDILECFTHDPFWVTTNDGFGPMSFDTIPQALEVIESIDD